jgi:hypothetical protein
MAAIALYMLALALVGVAGVLTHHYPLAVLILCSVFAVASLGLIRMLRWGWALTLGAAFCSICYWCYSLFRFHQSQAGVWAVINLVFFLYLVRPEVIARLR